MQDMRSWVRFSALTSNPGQKEEAGGGGLLSKFVHWEAPLRGSTPYPHLLFLTEKNLFSNTFNDKKVLLFTYLLYKS